MNIISFKSETLTFLLKNGLDSTDKSYRTSTLVEGRIFMIKTITALEPNTELYVPGGVIEFDKGRYLRRLAFSIPVFMVFSLGFHLFLKKRRNQKQSGQGGNKP